MALTTESAEMPSEFDRDDSMLPGSISFTTHADPLRGYRRPMPVIRHPGMAIPHLFGTCPASTAGEAVPRGAGAPSRRPGRGVVGAPAGDQDVAEVEVQTYRARRTAPSEMRRT